MLVLSRKQEEEIVFPQLGIAVRIIRTKGNQVRLGIAAPLDVQILRGELACESNAAATLALPKDSFSMKAQVAS